MSILVDSWPIISIITPCLNRADTIEEAITSVQAQGYPNVEHIIVDGGSTDGTLRVLERFPNVTVVSEADQGIYDALNKGIRMASGAIIGHLNSDDLYEPGALRSVGKAFRDRPEVEMVSGGAIVFSEDANGQVKTLMQYNSRENKGLSFSEMMLGIPIINARFFRKSTYERIGLYDARYKIAADREFLIRARLRSVVGATVDSVVYRYRQHPGSLTISGDLFMMLPTVREYMDISEKYMSQHVGSREFLRYLKLWHTKSAVRRLYLELSDAHIRDAIETIVRAWRWNPFWPMSFLRIVVQKFGKACTQRRPPQGSG